MIVEVIQNERQGIALVGPKRLLPESLDTHIAPVLLRCTASITDRDPRFRWIDPDSCFLASVHQRSTTNTNPSTMQGELQD
jgi:hypothetical protein